MARYEITNEQKPIEFEGLGEVKRIVQNCKNLLMTRLGEVPFDRLRGFNWALFDLPAEEFRTRLLPEVDRVLLWEPRAEAVVRATVPSDSIAGPSPAKLTLITNN